MNQRFNPYHQWLGIPKEKFPPTHYDLLGISLNEEDESVIQSAAQRQRNHTEQFLVGDHAKYARQVIQQVDEAEITLLDPELRRNYDRQVGLYQRRKKSRRFERVGAAAPVTSGTVTRDPSLFGEYLGVMSVVLGCFVIMAIVSFSFFGTTESSEAGRAAVVNDNELPPEPARPAEQVDQQSDDRNRGTTKRTATQPKSVQSTEPSHASGASSDVLPVGSIWNGEGKFKSFKLRVTERNGDRFTARFESKGWIREVSGTVAGRKVAWSKADVRVIKGSGGGDNEGTIADDQDGTRIDFVWRGASNQGTFTLRKQE